jgi:hypothetical protein
MKPVRIAAIAAAAVSLTLASPVLAQSEFPLVPGDYADMAMITIDDGHNLDYAKFLAANWRKQQEFAKSQGWISGYEILANVDKRPGEPDIYLVTHFKTLPDAAESAKRDDAFRKYMATTDSKMEQESGQRATYRHVIGTQLLQKLEWAK